MCSCIGAQFAQLRPLKVGVLKGVRGGANCSRKSASAACVYADLARAAHKHYREAQAGGLVTQRETALILEARRRNHCSRGSSQRQMHSVSHSVRPRRPAIPNLHTHNRLIALSLFPLIFPPLFLSNYSTMAMYYFSLNRSS
jgi:hypothetical protein